MGARRRAPPLQARGGPQGPPLLLVVIEINTLRSMVRASGIVSRRSWVWLCAGAALCCAPALVGPAAASSLSERARESKCTSKPVPKGGELYACSTESGVTTYFNVPGANESPASDRGARRASSSPSPAGFPKVAPETQRSRDDVRRKVLSDELATEEKLLADARAAYADGAPAPLPDEKADAEKYRARIGKMRQVLNMHEKNVEALKKEIANVK